MWSDVRPLTPSLPRGSRDPPRPGLAACLAEFLGTFLLVLIGPASVIVTALVPAIPPQLALVLIALSFASSVAVSILVLRRYSRVYLNPCITLAAASVGHLPARSVLPYVGFQILGGLAAGGTLWVLFRSADGYTHLGSTRLAGGIGPLEGIALEAAGTFVLALVALIASSRIRGAGTQALVVGAVLFLLILVLAPLTGAGFNPARSFGPALAAGFFDDLHVYILGPVAGGLSAALAFRVLYWMSREESGGPRSAP